MDKSEVEARIQSMTFSDKRQFWIDWDSSFRIWESTGLTFHDWMFQRAERLLYAEAKAANEDAGTCYYYGD